MADETTGTPNPTPEHPTPVGAPPAPIGAEPVPPAPSPTIPTPPKSFFWGVGRRKCAVARVRLRPGSGTFLVNNRKAEDYFVHEQDRRAIVAPLQITETLGKVDVFVNATGGGTTGQAGAVLLGIARALKTANPDYEPVLRNAGLLTRDSRAVERKKPGQAGARRRFQFSKR